MRIFLSRYEWGYLRFVMAACGTLLLFAAFPLFGTAQTTNGVSSLKNRVDALEKGQKEILKRLDAIQAQLSVGDKESPSSLILVVGDMPWRGSASAPVTLVEYFDYECPFCARYFDETMPQIEKDYVATGKLKYVARDFPLETIHPFALLASESARCANEQGKFWPMYNELMGNSDALDRRSISLYVHDIGLDASSFDKCLDSGKYAAEIRQDESNAAKIGVQGTPTFFLGIADQHGKTISHVERFDGAVDQPKYVL